MKFKDYEIGEFLIEPAIEDLKVLHAAHYAETEVHYKRHKVNVNYPHYIDCQKKGTLYAFGATVDAKQLVAYLFVYLNSSAHDSSTVATADMFYLLPEHRGSGIARRLIQTAALITKELGADYFILTDKSPLGAPHLKVLFESEGFQQIAIAYSKTL